MDGAHAVGGQGGTVRCRQFALLPAPVGRLRAVKGVRSPALVIEGDGGQGGRLGGVDGQGQVDPVVAQVTAQPGPEALPGEADGKTGADPEAGQADGHVGAAPSGHGREMLRRLTKVPGPRRGAPGRGQVDQALAHDQHP